VASEMTHADIRQTLSMHSGHVYNDSYWVEMSIRIYYTPIFHCNTNTSHYREQIFILQFYMNNIL